MTARCNGFLQAVPPADQLCATAAGWQDEGRTLHAIYDLGSRPDAALGEELPVATLATFVAGLDAGAHVPIPCTLIADVTVRATHRGRGLMRRLMQAATTDSSAAGAPLMALHAAHPALYERFGFAPAMRSASVDLDCSRFSLRTPPTGAVHEADPRDSGALARSVAGAASDFSFGGLSVVPGPRSATAGGGAGERCLIHVDDGGHVDGVVTYAFQGWTPHAQILEVLSETYSTATAHAALWQTLASTGIAATVRAGDVRLDDPLPWMLTDRAAWRVTGLTDGLSLRVLDPAAALRSRGYFCPDTELVVEVHDPEGPAAGRWCIRVADRHADVCAETATPDVTLHATGLAALFLGAVRASALRDAGLIRASRGAAEDLNRLLSGPVDPMSTLHF